MTIPINRCTAVTASGQPCKAYAMRDSDPPLCAPHAGRTGAPKGNTNALKHGFYRRRVSPAEQDALFDEGADVNLTQETILLRVLLHRLYGYLRDDDLPLQEVKTIAPLIISAARALGYLQDRLPDPNHVNWDWDAALDELGKEWGWEL